MTLAGDAHELAVRYAQTRDAAAREQMVHACTPLIQYIASRFAAQGIPREDLVQVGYLGLLSAIETFDPSRGVRFETYANPLIAGEMHHYVRSNLGTIRQPRWLRKINRLIDRAVDEYLDRHRRYPTLHELATALNITDDGLLEILRTRESVRTMSLDAEEDEEEYRINRRLIRHRFYQSFQLPIEDLIVLYDAIERLSLLQRRVLFHIFFRGVSQQKAAETIGISQRSVSRILAAALRQLRHTLTA
ncbi:MAG: sigma-70 family RNA polymerase sigma factor [Chloroflexi bacterium]|nr:sigma-70 family RNA polymerase sigma factor [Chloroflexota bacterium]